MANRNDSKLEEKAQILWISCVNNNQFCSIVNLVVSWAREKRQNCTDTQRKTENRRLNAVEDSFLPLVTYPYERCAMKLCNRYIKRKAPEIYGGEFPK